MAGGARWVRSSERQCIARRTARQAARRRAPGVDGGSEWSSLFEVVWSHRPPLFILVETEADGAVIICPSHISLRYRGGRGERDGKTSKYQQRDEIAQQMRDQESQCTHSLKEPRLR